MAQTSATMMAAIPETVSRVKASPLVQNVMLMGFQMLVLQTAKSVALMVLTVRCMRRDSTEEPQPLVHLAGASAMIS
jgi:hypothetical protein